MARLDLPFVAGIGLNTGVAITGNVGDGDVTDYSAIGDTVNAASRFSGLAKGGEILAGVPTIDGSGEAIPRGYASERISVQVKGKEQSVDAYRLYRV